MTDEKLVAELLPNACVKAWGEIDALMRHSTDDAVTIISQVAGICNQALASRTPPQAEGDVVELLREWRRLEDAFHDNLPNQGEPSAPSHGKALCQFVYDNSERIRAALTAREVEEMREGQPQSARGWAELIASQFETDAVDAIEEGVVRGKMLSRSLAREALKASRQVLRNIADQGYEHLSHRAPIFERIDQALGEKGSE